MGMMNGDLKMSQPALGGIKNNVFSAIADKTATKQKSIEPTKEKSGYGARIVGNLFRKANNKTSPEYLKQINKKRTNTILGD